MATSMSTASTAAAIGVRNPAASAEAPEKPAERRKDRERTSWIEAHLLDMTAESLEARPLESAEHLLRTVTRHERAHEDTEDEEKEVGGKDHRVSSRQKAAAEPPLRGDFFLTDSLSSIY